MKRVAVLMTFATALGAACQKAPEPSPTAPGVTAPAPAPAPGASALVRPLLWSVEKDGILTYFFGTMHAGIDANQRLPAVVWDKLDAARVFAMEANLDDPRVPALLGPTQGSLRQELGAAYWKKLEDAMGPSVASAVEHLPPLVPAAALAMRGLPSTPAMDKVLSARAGSAHKPIQFLEPATHQLAILKKWMDLRALKMMLDELPEGERRARAMLAAYAGGDERELLAIAEREEAEALRHGYTAAEYAQQLDDLLYQRNASWMNALEQLHADGGGFVAVGAMHLVGPRSVLDLLSRKGYRVTRIAADARPTHGPRNTD